MGGAPLKPSAGLCSVPKLRMESLFVHAAPGHANDRYLWMERCKVCGREANVVMILDDGARVPYCCRHHPSAPQEDEQAYIDFVRALQRFRG